MKAPIRMAILNLGLLLIYGVLAQEVLKPAPATPSGTRDTRRAARAPAPAPGTLPGKGLAERRRKEAESTRPTNVRLVTSAATKRARSDALHPLRRKLAPAQLLFDFPLFGARPLCQ